jgi:hypothetical protein
MRYDDIYTEIAVGTASDTVPAWALEVLTGVADGRVETAAVRHPLGFLCLPVERRDGYGVCLHLWTAGGTAAHVTTSDVHCHSWDLISYVLYGQVRNLLISIDGTSPTHRVFEVVSRGDIDEIRATPRTVSYASREVDEYRGGQTYTLPAGVFHSTAIPDGRAAATVALGRTTSDHGDLTLGPLDAPTHHVRRRRCDPEETVRAARRSVQHIVAAGANPP